MGLQERLRLVVITDESLARPRSVVDVVRAALAGGARTVQLREKIRPPVEILALARRLRALTREWDALLFVNDRLDVALASEADGVHLGPDDIPLAAVRRVRPAGLLVGYSTDDPDEALRAQADGADYLGCGTVYATSGKSDAGEAIGLGRLDEVARAVRIPVVGIGGITVARSADVAGTAASGVAVIGAVMGAEDPEAAARGLLEPFVRRSLRGGTAGEA